MINSKIFFFLLFFINTLFPQQKWYKGNLHTHSFWSDGDDFPENIIQWYKENDYDFIAISDHNILAEGEKWIGIDSNNPALRKYYSLFDSSWIETKRDSIRLFVRLKTFDEFVPLFEEPGNFLIIKSEEITDRFENKPVHLNAANVAELIPPQGGSSVLSVLQNNLDAVIEQEKRTGQEMLPHVNHPNFGWAITAEDLIALQGDKFFEVYNGHPLVNNYGDSLHPSTEKIWDIVLTERIINGYDIMYGIASDDAHNYHEFRTNKSSPGRGWIMVQADDLTPVSIISAMERGDFYATTGVEIEGIELKSNGMKLNINAEEGVTYTTYFIGTKNNYSKTTETINDSLGKPVRKIYSDEIGEILAEVNGINPEYFFTGDEIYIRAKVVSSKLKENPYKAGEFESAWVQPVIIKIK
jgi:hypothetical protein